MDCDNCYYNSYDENNDEYYCAQYLDEDLLARLMQNPDKHCPYWVDEYSSARNQ